MKLCGVMMVRNEADIIEAAVRHNLAFLDRLVVLDHGSFDGTSDILRQLMAEGLPLQVVADPSIDYQQSTRTTQLTRAVILRDQADFVFPLDADEFLRMPSRPLLEEALERLPPGMHALMHWQTYVPDDFDLDVGNFAPAHARQRLKAERQTLHKLIVARHFAERPRDVVADGNHLVWNLDNPGVMPPHARVAPAIAAVAHVPVRSRRQLEKKIIIGYLGHVNAQREGTRVGYHWRELYEEIRAGKSFDADRLRMIACNYGLPQDQWQPADAVELVVDPFAITIESRYRTDADVGTLQLLMRFCERLLASSRGKG